MAMTLGLVYRQQINCFKKVESQQDVNVMTRLSPMINCKAEIIPSEISKLNVCISHVSDT
jgi:hypothetical protein